MHWCHQIININFTRFSVNVEASHANNNIKFSYSFLEHPHVRSTLRGRRVINWWKSFTTSFYNMFWSAFLGLYRLGVYVHPLLDLSYQSVESPATFAPYCRLVRTHHSVQWSYTVVYSSCMAATVVLFTNFPISTANILLTTFKRYVENKVC